VLRRIFRLGRKVTGVWTELHSEECYKLYTDASTVRMAESRRMRWTVYVAHIKKRNSCKTLVGKPEGKRPLGRLRPRWMNII
jgi:hypothetical protein